MKIKNILHNLLLIGAFVSPVIMTGCVDDVLSDYDSIYDEEGADEQMLAFRISTKGLTESDDPFSGAESYIDPEKIRVLFFDRHDKFLFEVNRKFIRMDGTKADAVVRMRRTDLYSPIEQVYGPVSEQMNRALWAIEGKGEQPVDDGEEVDWRNGELESGFKIAVLANWPDHVDGPAQDIDGDGDPDVKSDPIPYDKIFTDFGEPLEHIYHMIYDNEYSNNYSNWKDEDGELNVVSEAFQHIVGRQGKMDVYSVWVKNYFQSKGDTRSFIRNGAGAVVPGLGDAYQGVSFTVNNAKSDSHKPWGYSRLINTSQELSDIFSGHVNSTKYTFEDVWNVWNFNQEKVFYDKPGETEASQLARDYWAERHSDLNEKVSDGVAKNGTFTYDGLIFQDPKKANKFELTDKAIRLKSSTNINAKTTSINDLEGVLRFRIYGEGTLNITYEEHSQNPHLRVIEHNGSDYITDSEVLPGYTNVGNRINEPITEVTSIGKDGDKEILTVGYKVTPNSDRYTDVIVMSIGGTINIREIEFIKGYYCYTFDRTGILPDKKDNPIPMYGIQLFDPIVLWPPYITFDLSNDRNKGSFEFVDDNGNIEQKEVEYDIRSVFLLRSIAKVEIKIAKSACPGRKKPNHIYLVSGNRSARCLPRDASTPTELLWYGWKGFKDNGDGSFSYDNKGYTKIDGRNYNYNLDKYIFYKERMGAGTKTESNFGNGIAQEIENIRTKGPICDGTTDNQQYYYERTAWLYGSWENDWEFNWNDKFPEGNIYNTKDLPYPRILNSRVVRSDFTRFIELPESDNYYNFVLYVPEKNLDDSDNRGNCTSNPKIAHIEMRFEDINEENNLDDLGSFRLYFLDYGENGTLAGKTHNEIEKHINDLLKKVKEGNDPTELYMDTMKELFPIVRNHVYSFTVTKLDRNTSGNVNFQVCGAAPRSTFKDIVFE